MKCSSCNNKLKKGTNFCPKCGQEIIIDANNLPEKNPNKFVSVFKSIGKGLYFIGTSIVYIFAVIFTFKFIMDLFENKKK